MLWHTVYENQCLCLVFAPISDYLSQRDAPRIFYRRHCYNIWRGRRLYKDCPDLKNEDVNGFTYIPGTTIPPSTQ